MSKNYTEKDMVNAATGSRGIVSVVARKLGCNWLTARRYLDKYPAAVEIEHAERDVLCDQAESVVVGLMKDEDSKIKLNAATYILDRLGKHRGFTTKQEVDMTVTAPTILDDVE